MMRRHQPFRVHRAQQPPVDAREALLLYLAQVGAQDFTIGARAKVQIDQIDRALPQALGDVLARDDQVLALIILPEDQNVTVRMARVEVVDSHPVELRPQILLCLGHEPADERLQVLIFRAVLRGDDEAELMPVFTAPFEKRFAIGRIQLGRIERSAFALSGRTVALQISQMRNRSPAALAREAHDSRLHDRPSAALARMAIGRAQHPAHSGAAADAAAVESARLSAEPFQPGGEVRVFEHAVVERAVLRDPAEPQLEVIVRHCVTSPAKALMRDEGASRSRASKSVSNDSGGTPRIGALESLRWRQERGLTGPHASTENDVQTPFLCRPGGTAFILPF